MKEPRELPILFNGSMVRAIIDGSKTQTRRIIKAGGVVLDPELIEYQQDDAPFVWWPDTGPKRRSPYGQPGDLLYVRETWCAHWGVPSKPVGKVLNSGERIRQTGGSYVTTSHTAPLYVYYRADDDELPYSHLRWKPSIHMPKDSSRIKLRVTDVRVERVWEISESDAYAEGVSGGDWMGDPIGEFEKLWDSINEKRAPWSDNPLVWAVTFERIKP